MVKQHPGLTKVGDFWHFELRVNGQRLHGSTRAKDLATAKRVLEEQRKDALLNQCGAPKVPSFSSLVEEWLRVHKGVHSRKHWRDVEGVSRIWVIPTIGGKRLDHLRNDDVNLVRSKMLKAGRSPVTVNDAMKILKLLCRYAIKCGYIRALPFRIEFLKVQRKPRPIVSATQFHEFLGAVDKAARNPHVAVILRVMLGLGLRESEALGMRWEWFDCDQKTYTVGKAKGKEARVLPVPDWLWNSIQSMPQSLSKWVFPAEDGHPHWSQFCKRALKGVCVELGLGNVTHHRLRATFASLHAQAGTPITEIQGMLGHKCITTTMIYIETSLEAKRRAQDALSLKLGLA